MTIAKAIYSALRLTIKYNSCCLCHVQQVRDEITKVSPQAS